MAMSQQTVRAVRRLCRGESTGSAWSQSRRRCRWCLPPTALAWAAAQVRRSSGYGAKAVDEV